MTRDPDDDALRWEGDDDPTLAPGWKTVGEPVRSEQQDAAASVDPASSRAGLPTAFHPGARVGSTSPSQRSASSSGSRVMRPD